MREVRVVGSLPGVVAMRDGWVTVVSRRVVVVVVVVVVPVGARCVAVCLTAAR